MGRCRYNEKSSARIFLSKISVSSSLSGDPSKSCDGQRLHSFGCRRTAHKTHRILRNCLRQGAFAPPVSGWQHLRINRWWIAIANHPASRKHPPINGLRPGCAASFHRYFLDISIQNHLHASVPAAGATVRQAAPCHPCRKTRPIGAPGNGSDCKSRLW